MDCADLIWYPGYNQNKSRLTNANKEIHNISKMMT